MFDNNKILCILVWTKMGAFVLDHTEGPMPNSPSLYLSRDNIKT